LLLKLSLERYQPLGQVHQQSYQRLSVVVAMVHVEDDLP
jgi:hypothetical protein